MFYTVDRERERERPFFENLICASVADHSSYIGLTSLTCAAIQISISYMIAIEVWDWKFIVWIQITFFPSTDLKKLRHACG
jgi:hypothetical protein